MSANKQFDFYNPDSMFYANSKHYIAQLEAMSRQQQAEIEALKEALEVKVILNEHAQQSMKEVKSLLRKAQEK